MTGGLPGRLMRAVRENGLAKSTEAIQSVLRQALPSGAGISDATDGGLLARLGSLPGLSGLAPGIAKPLNPGRTAPQQKTQAKHGKPMPAGAEFLSGTFTGPAGTRPYRLYVPSHRRAKAPLVVMLHGCTQTAEDFAAGTRMNEVAEAEGVLVLYPVQVASANAQRCWNWFNPGDQQRDSGEPSVIAGMTRQVMASYDIDPARVFAAGLSAGGAQAAILASAYPDLFAAIGVHSGLACGAASDMVSAFSAMHQGKAGRGQHAVPTIIFHGDSDRTVNIRNAGEVAAQTGASGAAEVEQGKAAGGMAYTRSVQRDSDGRARLEQWVVHGAGHAWSGGSREGSYTEPAGPDASREILRFFLSLAGQKRH